MLGLLMAAAFATATVPYDAADEAAAREWIAQAGHRFNPGAFGPADLAPLVERLRGARVIGIGEATHGTQQDEAFKAELIKALVRSGAIDTVAIECNRAAGEGFDRYVRTGEGDPAALIRSPSFFAIWHNDAFGGLLLWLRAWNQTAVKPVRVIGIDDQDSGTDAAEALAFLARYDPATARRLRAQMPGLLAVDGGGKHVGLYDYVAASDRPTVERVTAALESLEQAFRQAPARWRRDPGFDEAAYAAKVARQGLFVFAAEYKGADKSKLSEEYYSRRDKLMAENLVQRVGQGRAALWAHDEHVADGLSPADEAHGYKTLGMWIEASLKDEYRTVGFTWSQATVHVVALANGTPNPPRGTRRFSDVPLGNDRPGDFGHVFSALPGDGWWLDLRARPHTAALDRWGARNLYHGFAGWRVDPAHWQDNPDDDALIPPDRGYDIMVWFRTMTPAQVWPEPAAKAG